MNNRILYYILSLLSVVFLTPLISVVISQRIPGIEGRPFVLMAILPKVFLALLLVWILEILVLSKKIENYYKKRNIFSILVIVVAAGITLVELSKKFS